MGDTGALFLGYVLSYVSVQGLFKTHAFLAFVVPVIIFGLPIFDTGFAFIRRIVHGKNPFIGDAGHLHHRLLAIGFSERKTVATLYLISGIFGIAAILLSGAGIIWTAGVAFVCSILIILVISFKSKKH